MLADVTVVLGTWGGLARSRASEEVRRLEAMVVPRHSGYARRRRGSTLVVEWYCYWRSTVCEVGCVKCW